METQLFPLCLVTGVFASPIRITTGQCTTKIDNFDDLQASPAPLIGNEIGLYNGLRYDRFAATSASGVTGVAAKSPNITAGLGLTRTLTTQVAEFLTSSGDKELITLFPSGTLSAPTGKYFDLLEFTLGASSLPFRPRSALPPDATSAPRGLITWISLSLKNHSLMCPSEKFENLKKMKNVTITLASTTDYIGRLWSHSA
ncbi:hypothetical protein BST61_g3323 [Cercospora zeina]